MKLVAGERLRLADAGQFATVLSEPAWMKGQRMQICVDDRTKHTVIGSMKGAYIV